VRTYGRRQDKTGELIHVWAGNNRILPRIIEKIVLDLPGKCYHQQKYNMELLGEM
jgi:hypothetical protein